VLDGSGQSLSKKATTQPKHFYFDHEIMEIGLICSNMIENMPAILGTFTFYFSKVQANQICGQIF
jgi:hypothetical protein